MMRIGMFPWGLMLCVGFLFLVLIAAAVVWAARSWSGSRSSGAVGGLSGPAAPQLGGDRALDILRERYARGEITKEQYDEMRRNLTV